MAIETRPVEYREGEVTFRGVLASDGSKKPIVLIAPTVHGVSDFEIGVAKQMAEWGYAGLVVDVYGADAITETREQCFALMKGLLADRPLLQRRLLAAVDAAKAAPEASGPLAMMGFCFGGTCALDAARAGADLAGAIGIHGWMSEVPGAISKPIKAKILAQHGWDDPIVPEAEVTALASEMKAKGVDWQLQVYGGAMHGFILPHANMPAQGAAYNPVVARRAWAAVKDFLGEVFG